MKAGKSLVPVQIPSEPLAHVEDALRGQGIVEWAIKSRPGVKIFVGRTRNGGAIRQEIRASNGFRERTASTCVRMAPNKRRIEAKRMYKRGLTQTEIAERLGCSQKTVSNDLHR